AKLDLSLVLEEKGAAGLLGKLRYNRDLFDAPTMARLLGHWQSLLAAAAEEPGLRLSALPLLSAAEAQQRREWNATAAVYPLATCLHQLIEAQVERTPEAPAVVFEGEVLSYREIDAAANRVAHRLRDVGVGPDVPVGICLERSLELMVGLLAILKAGGAYVPLDPSYPAERLSYMLEDSRVPVLVTAEGLGTEFGARRLTLDGGWWREGAAVAPVENRSQPESLAYVIYTSGSTG